MEQQLDWQEGGSQGPTTLDLDLTHMGCQFEETDIEGNTSSSELAHTTPPNYAQMEDSESRVQIADGSVVEMSSSPELPIDSSSEGEGGANTSAKELELLKVDRDWTVPKPSDPWSHLTPWHPESLKHFQKLYRHLPSAQVPSNSSADAAGIAATQSDSGYASIPKDAPGATPKLQTEVAVLESRNIPSAASISEPIIFQRAEDTGESQTAYSDQNSEDARRAKEYIWEFTKYLYQRIDRQLTSMNLEKAIKVLPKLLGAYAKKMGQTSLIQINRDIMYSVYKHRKLIPQLLKIIYEDDQAVIREPDTELMSTNDKIDLLWSKGSDTDNPSDPEGDLDLVARIDDDDDSDNNDYPPEGDFSQYRDAIIEHPSFEWLIQRLSIVLSISPTDSYAMMAISQRIEEALHDDDRISRTRALKPFTVMFEVNCDILTFVREQQYHELAADVIPNVVALTGTNATNVQIASPEQYLRKVWPTIGCHLLETTQGALRVYDPALPFQNSVAYTYADRTKIKVSIGERNFRVETVGTAHSIAEIAEQIGWLAATLRSGDSHPHISLCRPEIIGFNVKNNRNMHAEEDELGKTFVCKVEVFIDEIVPNLPSVDGQCWMAMFNNPVIVKGYPINPREGSMPITGLEMAWEDMIAFTHTPHHAIVGGKIVMKGFSEALIPTGVHGDIISWHYFVDESGARFPYGDPRIQQGMFVPSDQLGGTCRHVIGWCANAQNNIGSPNGNYDIKGSGLSSGGGGLTWEGLDINVGVQNCATVTSTLRRGMKDMPICEPSPLYRSLVEHVGQHYFMLYDVEERRGYLSNGLPVLLHLVLASLRWGEKYNSHDFYTDAIERLKKIPLSTQGTQAAKQILYDSANWVIKLHLDDIDDSTTKDINHLLKDRVKSICHLLEAAIEKANKAITQGALKGTPKNLLGGFDFMDIAVCRPLKPITEKLQIANHGTGWTDLADCLGALPLFGNNFGDLIKPEAGSVAKSCNQCGSEPNLPSGKNYVAVCVDVLKEIRERNNGCKNTTPWPLIDGLRCHIDKTDFEPCRCISSNRPGSSHDRVQVLSSKDSFLDTASANPNDIDSNGAVIFGHKPIVHKRNKNGGNIFTRSSRKTTTMKKGCSPGDSIQLQVMNTAVGVPSLSATEDGNSEANENQLSDTVSSATPDTFTSSGASGVDSNNTTMEQQSQTSNAGPPKPKPAVATPQIASVAPPIMSLKGYGRKLRDICRRAWEKK
ncbi:uncharacterized protein Triagg1_5077 [Trichoderma aggressivum f. europaeum]|uniref:Uncharacterized protein n=1 Tax=Trichoderma aggressivum f. europaeum TaxID=173218 RepID=A0AAE1ICT2_9HYPO|nr:hypothetical protein Triagg1_5077 [Trichoderma aggressivum f. europaeum]